MITEKKILLIIFLLLLINTISIVEAATNFSQTGKWIEKANTPQSGGYGESLIGANNNIFVARCMYASSTPYFWCYNSSVDNWDFMDTSGIRSCPRLIENI